MPLLTRTESEELKKLRILNSRMDLPPDEKLRYSNLEKGFQGEVLFDSLTAGLDNKYIIMNGLYLENNNTSFQIDSLFIAQESIIPFEIKNYEGNYLFKDDNFYLCSNKKPITNPLHQLNRSTTLLHQLLQKHKLLLPISGYVNFINPEFFLYQAPENNKIIYRPQQNRFLNELCKKPSNLQQQHSRIADFILKAHNPKPPILQLPTYHYEVLRKGFMCGSCHSLSITIGERIIICTQCGFKEKLETAILRNIEEVTLLFPSMRITTNTINDWCGLEEHKRKTRRILVNNFKSIGHGKYTYYVNYE